MRIDYDAIDPGTGDELLEVTPAHSTSLLRQVGRYGLFPARVVKAVAEDTLMAVWEAPGPSITIGIETDGYAHS